MNTPDLSNLWILIRREIWESQFTFKWTPVIIAGFILLFTVLILLIGVQYDNEMVFTTDLLRQFVGMEGEQKRLIISGSLFSIAGLFIQIMFLVLVFYLAGCLYDDRRDRSILYWKSLPVSDTTTVLSKILAACVIAPLAYLAVAFAVQLILLAIGTGYALMADLNPWTELWMNARLPRQWTLLVYGGLVQSLWLLPIYGWLLFCSSWVPRLPFLVAVLVPILIGIFQHFWAFFTNFALPQANIFLAIVKRIGEGLMPASIRWQDLQDLESSGGQIAPNTEFLMSFSSVTERLLSMEMWLGVLIGVVFVAAAVYFRRRATDA